MIIKNISIVLMLGSLVYANSTLNYINNIRVKSGCSSLSLSNKLSYAAKKHAIYLATNKLFGHKELSYKRNFYAKTPWQRIVKAGFNTRAVVENITFYEPSYKASIDKIMATVYHRLAFLDTKVDTIGFGRYKRVYVYDMSNNQLAKLCVSSQKKGLVSNICKNPNKTLSKDLFYRVLTSTKRKSRSIIFYPYNKQSNVGIKLEREVPSFLNRKGYGFPITVTLNSGYYNNIKLKMFKLYSQKKEISSKIVTFRNDIRKKLNKNSFVLIPNKKLLHKRVYKVVFKAISNGKSIEQNWSFTTN